MYVFLWAQAFIHEQVTEIWICLGSLFCFYPPCRRHIWALATYVSSYINCASVLLQEIFTPPFLNGFPSERANYGFLLWEFETVFHLPLFEKTASGFSKAWFSFEAYAYFIIQFRWKGKGKYSIEALRQRWWCGGGIWLSLKATRRRVFAICMHNLLSVCDAAYY